MREFETSFQRFLQRYGQAVRVCRQGAGEECHAFIQPVLERREDWHPALPTPVGVLGRERWLYLGDAKVSLAELGDGYVQWGGRRFDVVSAQEVYIGSHLSHWWAVLVERSAETSGAGD